MLVFVPFITQVDTFFSNQNDIRASQIVIPISYSLIYTHNANLSQTLTRYIPYTFNGFALPETTKAPLPSA